MQEEVIKMVEQERMSSIQLMSGRLGIPADEVRVILKRLVDEGKLNGKLSEDGERFFSKDLEPSEPKKPPEPDTPDFLAFDPRPGRIVMFFGFLILAIGLVFGLTAPTQTQQDQYLGVGFVGILIFMAGCYYLGTRRTP
ncbi:MAG: hypothetical protein BAJATHORv1_60059 [Candidatus Thorarchaeota archaeon]|nr:MAG: hypothetical protein BAJATHORv1_60059 [Candidatus Thorarchaeota archaeon]